MNPAIRLKLDMGDRVHEFCLAHPSDDPGYAGLVSRLKSRLDRARDLAEQELNGHLAARAVVISRVELKEIIREHLQVAARLAELAAVEEPGFDVRVQAPTVTLSHRAFVTAARVALGQVEAEREVFERHGMPVGFLDEALGLVDHYEAMTGTRSRSVRAHVGANADLAAVASEVLLVVHLLDRLHRVRFRKDAELLAAWRSAREVPWRRGNGQAEEPEEGPGPGPETGPAEGAQPAA